MKSLRLLAALGLATSVSAAYAVDVPQATLDTLLNRIDQLENKVTTLEQRDRASLADGKTALPASTGSSLLTPPVDPNAPVITLDSEKGFKVETPDKKFSLKISGILQFDNRIFLNDNNNDDTDSFAYRRIRPTISGTVGKIIDFRFTPEFAAPVRILDAYVDVKPFDWLQFRVGQYKPALGLERLQSAGNVLFAERGWANELVPTRDLGASIQGKILGGTFDYSVGLYNGVNDGFDGRNTNAAGDTNDDFDIAGRLFITPFKRLDVPEFLKGFGFGAGFSSGTEKGFVSTYDSANQVTYKSPGRATVFRYDNTAGTGALFNGVRERFNPQAYYYYGPFGLLGEYVQTTQEVARGGVTRELQHNAWTVQASYLLTGETASYNTPVKVRNPVTNGGLGAWEIGVRYGEIDIDDDAFIGRATAATINKVSFPATRLANPNTAITEAQTFGVVLNWYLTNNLRAVVDYSHTEFTGGGPALGKIAVTDREDEDVLTTRLQFTF